MARTSRTTARKASLATWLLRIARGAASRPARSWRPRDRRPHRAPRHRRLPPPAPYRRNRPPPERDACRPGRDADPRLLPARTAAVIRDFARAAVIVLFFLLIVAEVQEADEPNIP